MMKRILITFGTRPEFIKLLPVIYEIKRRKLDKKFVLVHTGQHRKMVFDLFDLFKIYPEYSFTAFSDNQSLGSSLSEIIGRLQIFIDTFRKKNNICFILAQGDTTSAIAAAMVAFVNKIPFAHLEAGLRTYDLFNPFPEEFYRRTISLTATIQFAPTIRANNNLRMEGISQNKIIITGNTIVDFVTKYKKILPENSVVRPDIKRFFDNKNNVVITCHRRENQNKNFFRFFEMVKQLSAENRNLNFLWISHSNPFIRKILTGRLKTEHSNFTIIKPLNIAELFELYRYTKVIITDSGGIQEESVSFGIPTIVIRAKTERIESLEHGYSKIVNPFDNSLKKVFQEFLCFDSSKMRNPYGDGNASEKIVDFFERDL